MAIGVDIGTAFLCSARRKEDNTVKLAKIRDAFFTVELTAFVKQMLESMKVNYIEKDGELFVIGDEAVDLASSFNKEARRPMSQGMLSPKEKEALPIIRLIIEKLVGTPKKDNEILYFSVPANPIDSFQDVNYHGGMVKAIMENIGYSVSYMNEALAVIYSELLDKKFTGIGISFGAGMVNCCFANLSIPVFNFSIAKSGDWIDKMVAQSQGIVASKVTGIKENDLDLKKDQNNIILKSLKIYYETLIDYVLKLCIEQFKKVEDLPNLGEGICIAVAGGTSMPPGFIDLFKERLQKSKFPVKIAEVRHSKRALYAVATGCLIAAESQEKKEEKISKTE